MNIYILSPDKAFSDLLFDGQAEEYNQTVFSDCEAAREQITVLPPDVVIMDHTGETAEMFAFCRELKSSPDHCVMLIILSDNQETVFWLEAYDAGVDHILTKSAERDILKLNLGNMLRCINQRKLLASNLSETQKIAMTAMTGNSELGQIIRFVQKSYTIYNYQELADSFFSVTNGLGLRCCLMVKATNERHVFSSDGEIKKLEEDIFSLVKGDERFFDFGCRTIISYPNVVLLVKNMPLEDAQRYGHIKDLLPTLLDVVNEKVVSLETSMFIQSQTERLSESFDAIKRSFQYISELSRENLHEGTNKMQEMLLELNNHLPGMGLEEDQEVFILDRVEGAISDSRRMLNMSDEMETIFTGIHNNLQSIVEQQNQLLVSLHKSSSMELTAKHEGDEFPEVDVELF